ncbi:MAG: hypothetical protein IPF93_08965 [Saprospiraceae bacterium]|nr:hypothetical protein [Saprospiraceae bacterium]
MRLHLDQWRNVTLCGYDRRVVTCIALDTTYTDVNGLYLFDSLRAGRYIVEITPDNFAPGGPLEGF